MTLSSLLQNPTTETVFIVYIINQVFSAMVQSLPNPKEFGGIWYKSFYNFLTILAADFKSFVPAAQAASSQRATQLQQVLPTINVTGTTQTIQSSGVVGVAPTQPNLD